MITFPLHPTRDTHDANNPFTDANHKDWIWTGTKWQPYIFLVKLFDDLDDKTTVNLPGINTPLSVSLAGKAVEPYKFYNGVAGTAEKVLASIPITAEYMVSGQPFWLDMDIAIHNQVGTPAALATALSIDFVTGHVANNTSSGTIIDVGFARVVHVKYNGLIFAGTNGLEIEPYLAGALHITQQAAAAVPATIPKTIFPDAAAGSLADSGAGAGFVYGVPETIRIYLMNLAGGVTSTITSGRVSLVPFSQ